MERLLICAFFLNLILNLPGCKIYLYNKTMISSRTILENLVHDVVQVISQLLSLQYQSPSWEKDEFLPEIPARLDLSFIALVSVTR